MKIKTVVEEWRDVLGFEGYYKVSNFGKVASCDRQKEKGGRKRNGRILKTWLSNGQECIKFCVFGEIKSFLVSRLVAEAFIKSLKEGEMVLHLDMIKNNNRFDNLVIKNNMSEVMPVVNSFICDGSEIIERKNMTSEKAREYLYYKDGDLFFKKKTAITINIGDKAGFMGDGHWRIYLCGHSYMRNQIIYLIMTGKFSDFVLTKNGNNLDGRIENLYGLSASEYAIQQNRINNIINHTIL
jgi:hypothetical protein